MCSPGVDGSKNPQHCLSLGTTRILMEEEGTLLHNGAGRHSVRSVFFHLLSLTLSLSSSFYFVYIIFSFMCLYIIYKYNINIIYIYIYIYIYYTLIRDASVRVYIIIICTRICMYTFLDLWRHHCRLGRRLIWMESPCYEQQAR